MGEVVGPAADVYALAATAYEMLSGAPPFVGEIAHVLAAKTTREAPALPSHVPARVRITIARMLARSPGDRIASMAEVLAELDRWPGSAPNAVTAEVEPARPTRSRVLAIGLGLAVLAAAAALIIALVARRDPTPARDPAPQPVVTPLPEPTPTPVAPAPAPAPTEAVVVAPAPAPPVAPIKKRPAHATSKPTKSHHDDVVIVDPYTE